MRIGFKSLATAGLVVGLALAACGAGAGGAAVAPPAGPSLLGEKAPGPYTANGSVGAAAGRASTEMSDAMRFQPNTVTDVKAGETVTIELRNSGATAHSFVSPSLGVREKVVVQPGQT